MVIIRNLDVCEVASDRDQIRGGILTVSQTSLTLVDVDSVLFVSVFTSTDGVSLASASSSASTISSSGDSSSSSSSSATI